MKALQVVSAFVTLFITLPITFVLQYKILATINATDIMWLLFWVNLPLALFMQFVLKLAEMVAKS